MAGQMRFPPIPALQDVRFSQRSHAPTVQRARPCAVSHVRATTLVR